MERLVPQAAAPASSGSSALRSTLYTQLAVALALGAWVKFNDQIAALAPSLAAPPGILPGQAGEAGAPIALISAALVPQAQDKAAVAGMGLPDQDTTVLLQALARGRLRLAQLPLMDVSPVLQGPGHVVEVSSAGYTRQVLLTRDPVVVTLPVAGAGTISFSTAETGGVGILSQTLSGPVQLPDLQAGHVFSVGVIAQ